MKVTIMRGLPGSGKSTYIENQFTSGAWDRINTLICGADHYFTSEGEYLFDGKALPDAHRACMHAFLLNLARFTVHGYTGFAQPPFLTRIVVDNTNVQRWEYMPYVSVAEAMGAEVELIHVYPPGGNKHEWIDVCAKRNSHGVPRKSIEAMINRWEEPLPWQKETVTKT